MRRKNADSINEAVVQANDQKLKQYAADLNRLRRDVDTHNALSVKHGKMTLEFAIKAGGILREVKKIAPFGDWETWLKENVKGFGQRTAEHYMKLAEMAAEPKHVSFFKEAEGLREAYIKFGIITVKPKTKTKTPTPPKQSGEMTPEEMKEKDDTQYKAKWGVARQDALKYVHKKLEEFKQVNWDLTKWTVKKNKPCSDEKGNVGGALFKALERWVAKREFSSSLTHEDEVSTKAGIVLNEVVKTIILANTTSQTKPTIKAKLEDIGHLSMKLNPEPATDAELATA